MIEYIQGKFSIVCAELEDSPGFGLVEFRPITQATVSKDFSEQRSYAYAGEEIAKASDNF